MINYLATAFLTLILFPHALNAATPASGAACTDYAEGSSSCYKNGCYICTSGLWVAQPLIAGTDTNPTCSIGGLVRWNGAAFQGCDGTSWVPLDGSGDGSANNPYFYNSGKYTSCLAIKNGAGVTKSGLYQMTLGGTKTNAYCDMVTDGGGYTLVKAAIGTQTVANSWLSSSGYTTTLSGTLASNNYALPDSVINATKTAVYRVEATCNSWSTQTTAYAQGACVYGSDASADNSANCRQWYTSAALSSTLGSLENYGSPAYYFGIRDVHTSFSGSYITTQNKEGSDGYMIGSANVASKCTIQSSGSAMRIWVK